MLSGSEEALSPEECGRASSRLTQGRVERPIHNGAPKLAVRSVMALMLGPKAACIAPSGPTSLPLMTDCSEG